MSLKPEVQPQTQAQTPPPPEPEVYDDSPVAYIARRDAWLAEQATGG